MDTKRRLLLIVAATAIHAAVAGVAVSPLFFVPNVATAQRVFGGSNGEKNLFEDVRAYHEYASRTLGGEIPYRDFAVEYPIGALPFFLMPRLVAAGPIAYRWAFAIEMLLCDAMLVALIAARGERTIGAVRAVAWYSVCLGSLAALPIARFDLAAALLAFGAALAWESGREGLGGVLAGFGGLTKLFPLTVAGPAIVGGRWRGLLAAMVTMALGAAIWLAIGGSGVVRAMRYHSGRGLEIESLYAGVLMILAKASGWAMSQDFNHSSVELIAPGARLAAAVAPIVQLTSIAIIILATRRQRSGRERFVTSAGACVLAFALFGKVLSPQYMLWILPFVVTMDDRAGRWARPILVFACLMTTLVYFWSGVGLLNFHPLAIAILNARNGVLVAIFVIMIRELPTPALHSEVAKS
jgi:Glycosyltransferase family 87